MGPPPPQKVLSICRGLLINKLDFKLPLVKDGQCCMKAYTHTHTHTHYLNHSIKGVGLGQALTQNIPIYYRL